MNTVVEREKREKRNGTVAERGWVAPEVNIYEREEGYILEAEMPGVTKEGLEITLEGNTLTFIGRRHHEVVPGTVLYQESEQTDYRRVFELDTTIDTNKISAEMHQGILTLILPKAERVKPRKIEIK